MRPLARLAAVLSLLAACQMQTPAPGPVPAADTLPLASDTIAVTPLGPAKPAATVAAPQTGAPVAVQVPGKTTPRPTPRPAPRPNALGSAQTQTAPAASAPAATPAPAPIVSPEQALCEKSRGQWSASGSSTGHVCVHTTRDSGKACHRKGDCQGECLAQSGTCSPITPLMGCNDILQADGTEVTLCLQ